MHFQPVSLCPQPLDTGSRLSQHVMLWPGVAVYNFEHHEHIDGTTTQANGLLLQWYYVDRGNGAKDQAVRHREASHKNETTKSLSPTQSPLSRTAHNEETE